MRLEIGNKVAVLDDVIEGHVTEIKKNNIIVIKDSAGMLFEFHHSELIKITEDKNRLAEYTRNDMFLKQKLQSSKKKNFIFKKAKREIIMEVDLHIEKLVNSTRGMDNYDILTLQIDTAKRKLEYCIQKKISKIVFIHGVGEGVLRAELQYLLKKYSVKYYDASYQKYGLGATEVYIYQNQ